MEKKKIGGIEVKLANIEDEIDMKFLESNTHLQRMFSEKGIRTYADIRKTGYKGIMMIKGVGYLMLQKVHLHMIGKGFKDGLPGYRKMPQEYLDRRNPEDTEAGGNGRNDAVGDRGPGYTD